jgi:4-hydroxybenzoate polyprenyltransferase
MNVLGIQAPPQQVTQESASRLGSVLDRLWDSVTSGGSLEKLAIFLLLGLALYALSRVIRRAIEVHIDDINQRHRLRKVVTYTLWIALALSGVTLFAENLAGSTSTHDAVSKSEAGS